MDMRDHRNLDKITQLVGFLTAEDLVK